MYKRRFLDIGSCKGMWNPDKEWYSDEKWKCEKCSLRGIIIDTLGILGGGRLCPKCFNKVTLVKVSQLNED